VTIWTLDDPIKNLWECSREIQCISEARGDPITNAMLRDLTFLMFDTTGVFGTACDTWHICPAANQTLIEFCAHFTMENKECIHKLMVAQLGYHAAKLVITEPSSGMETSTIPAMHSANSTIICTLVTLPTGPPCPNNSPIITDNATHMYYCWGMHGLGLNKTHNSSTCNNTAPGHQATATASNMQGGNNTIQARGSCCHADQK